MRAVFKHLIFSVIKIYFLIGYYEPLFKDAETAEKQIVSIRLCANYLIMWYLSIFLRK